jgi:hypothetical protein
MTPTSDPVISALGPKAAGFFRSYRTAGLKAVEDAARDNDDAIEIYVTQSAKYVAGSWGSKFGHREARHASYEFAAFLTAVGIMALSLWGMWLACTHFGFSTIGMAAASVASIAALGALTLALAFLVATEGMHAPCKFCLAVSLWTRGWTPLSMEWEPTPGRPGRWVPKTSTFGRSHSTDGAFQSSVWSAIGISA